MTDLWRLCAFTALATGIVISGTGSASADPAPSGVDAIPEIEIVGAGSGGLAQAPSVGKTGTKLEDLPASIAIVQRSLIDEQGGVSVRDALRDVGGVAEGGQSSYGFFDRFNIRGLDPNFLTDGFSDGPSNNGFSRSMNGVERIEVLKGPGSALLGSGAPGGSINIVHQRPSPTPQYELSTEYGSFNASTTTGSASGPTSADGLGYRVDMLYRHADGFRNLEESRAEFMPQFQWQPTGSNHTVSATLDFRHIEATPDTYGIPYVHGQPLDIDPSTRYATPFSRGDQDILRLSATDAWTATDYLTVNNRLSFLHRDLDILRNTSPTIGARTITGRQLRSQQDEDREFLYQLEPLWHFSTAGISHSLLTGFEVQRQEIDARRATADLPSIANLFAPVIPEASVGSLAFKQDATHSGFDDALRATYLGFYATDQMDLTETLKLRLGARVDQFETDLTPNISVAGRTLPGGKPILASTTYSRDDTPASWSAGLVYEVLPGLHPFIGVSRSNLALLSSESTTSGVQAPEQATQYEAGLKASLWDGKATVTGALYKVKRKNVFTTVGTNLFFNSQMTRGMDLDADFIPLPGWHVIANLAAQNPELTDNPSNRAVEGKRPIGIASQMANLWTSYEFALGDLDGFKIGGGLQYRGAIYGDQPNTQRIPSYALFDVALSFTRPEYELAAGIKNLTDREYYRYGVNNGALPGDPRTAYARATLRF